MGNYEEKAVQVDSMRDRFSRCSAAVLLDFRGITVDAITDLRVRFREAGVDYKVVKNNLIRRALSETPFADDASVDGMLKGPTAIAWSYEDPSAAAKVIKAFRKEGNNDENLVVKFALLGEQVLNSSQVETQLASLPGKDEIRAQLLATLQAAGQGLARQLLAPAQNLVYALEARRREEGEAA